MSENIIEITKNISVVLGTIISLITLTTLIVKPIRQKFINFIRKSTNDDEQNNLIKSQGEAIEKENENIIEIKNQLDKIVETISALNEKVFNNEKDRLRGEIFNCGNRCRRGIPLSREEFRYIQSVYEKYSVELHCNSIGTEEYNFIRDYFNSTDNQNNIK